MVQCRNGAILLIAPGCVGLVASPYAAIGLLAIGQFADKIGVAPLFACLGLFDLIGAIWLLALRRRLTFAKA